MWFLLLIFPIMVQAQEKNSLHDTFNRIGKIVEADGCPSDFVKPVGDLIAQLCTKAKEGTDVEPVDYLKDSSSSDSPQLFCSYDEGIYEVMVGDTSDEPTASQVKISMTDSGQITEITKDELKVEGQVCHDLAINLDKGGRIPASVDTELCFDYYPSPKLMVGKTPPACGKKKKLSTSKTKQP